MRRFKNWLFLAASPKQLSEKRRGNIFNCIAITGNATRSSEPTMQVNVWVLFIVLAMYWCGEPQTSFFPERFYVTRLRLSKCKSELVIALVRTFRACEVIFRCDTVGQHVQDRFLVFYSHCLRRHSWSCNRTLHSFLPYHPAVSIMVISSSNSKGIGSASASPTHHHHRDHHGHHYHQHDNRIRAKTDEQA